MGVDLEFSEIKLTERRGSGKNRRTVTTFKGVAIMMDLGHKKFFGHTIIARDSGKMGEWFKKRTTGLDRANLVDPEFEKLFDVYTNDQVEARYLIDPDIMQRLKALYDEYTNPKADRVNEEQEKIDFMARILGAREKLLRKKKAYQGLSAAFYESKMLILIASPYNHFEPADIHTPATDPQSILSMKREIEQILSVIEKLKLYDPVEIHSAA